MLFHLEGQRTVPRVLTPAVMVGNKLTVRSVTVPIMSEVILLTKFRLALRLIVEYEAVFNKYSVGVVPSSASLCPSCLSVWFLN